MSEVRWKLCGYEAANVYHVGGKGADLQEPREHDGRVGRALTGEEC